MEEIELIIGDSSDLYEFSSKQVSSLDSSWEGSWVVSVTLGGTPITSGSLAKNPDILNEDSLVGEEVEKSYKIFKGEGNEIIDFNTDVLTGDTLTVSGNMYTLSSQTQTPVADQYAYITIKGIFSGNARTERIKTDINGDFSVDISLLETIKIPANSYFIFQILPSDSALLTESTYYVTAEIRQKDQSQTLIFRKEVLQAKLKMKKQGVIS